MKTEKILGYEVHRKKVKNINLRIKPNMEIYISVPMNLHRDYIENFIRSKEGWIKSVLKKVEDVKEKQKGFEYKTGEIHKFLGKEYYYLNWYCDKLDDEERADYLQRSYDKAKEGIMEAKKTADRLGEKCYIVLVTEYIHLT